MPADYEFRTVWRVAGTVDEVRRLLADGESLPQWWPAVYLAVNPVQEGDDRGVGSRAGAVHHRPAAVHAAVDAADRRTGHRRRLRPLRPGRPQGRWALDLHAGTVAEVVITYDWRVSASKPLLRRLTWLLRPVFTANHHWAMARGEESLRLELRRRRATSEAERRRVPPPPPATFRRLIGRGRP